jgi:putative transposase
VVTPAARRQAAGVCMELGLSQRRSCALVRLSRSSLRYQPRRRDDSALRSRLRELAALYPRYGHPLLHGLLRSEGLVRNRKRSYRIYREEALGLKRRRRGKLRRERLSLVLPAAAGQRWSMDFVSDQLANGRRFRVLNVIDDFTRECVLQVVDTGITGVRVARELSQCELRLPAELVCDNGPEFTSKALFTWASDNGVQLCFIQPGKPTQNAFVESFNGKFREACLSQHWFRDLAEARTLIEDWRLHYNTVRPHSAHRGLPPSTYAKLAA